jgi:hypothetical protein
MEGTYSNTVFEKAQPAAKALSVQRFSPYGRAGEGVQALMWVAPFDEGLGELRLKFASVSPNPNPSTAWSPPRGEALFHLDPFFGGSPF